MTDLLAAFIEIELLLALVGKISLVIVVAYLITRTKHFNNLIDRRPTFADRLILMLIFGGFSIYGTYSGVEIFGAIANTRDLGPMVAGLVGGPFMGLGVGLIGGIHRYLLGGFTRLPCALATIISGILGGLIYLLKGRKFVRVYWAAIFAILMESFHMLLALLIAKPFSAALQLVEEIWLPMIGANAIGVGIFALMINNLIREKRTSSERDRYYAEVERKIYEMEKLYRLGVQVSSTLDINVVLDLCINATVEVLEAQTGVLFLVDDKSKQLVLGSMVESNQEMPESNSSLSATSVKTTKREGERLSQGEGIASWVAQHKESLVVNDVDGDERFCPRVFQGLDFKIKSSLCVPLMVKDRIIGVIQVCNKKKVIFFDKKDEHLLGSFAVHAAIAIENAKLYQEVAEKERMKRELEIAHSLQTSLLPDKPPQAKGYQIAAISVPAREVGGDFYDFIDVAEGRIGLVIGDVAGKGLPAALFMALSRSFVRAEAIGNLKPPAVLEKANRLISKDAKEGMFVTVFYSILDVLGRKLRFSNAGHNPPLLFRSATGECEELRLPGIALGAFNEAQFQEQDIALRSGDLVVFYTDGVTEPINYSQEQFGMERLISLIKNHHQTSAEEMVRMISERVKQFAGDQPQFDDFTLMVVKVT